MRRRKPEVYVDDTCVSCKCAKEDSDHLVKCTGYTNYWGIVEEVACLLAWKKLDRAHKRTISVERFGLLIGGVIAEKRFKRRRDYIRGLIPDDVVAELLNLELPKKIVNRALGSYTALVESSFLDEIWRIRCNAVAEWEKEIGIDTAMKRSNPRSSVKEGAITDKNPTSRVRKNKSKGEISSAVESTSKVKEAEVIRLFEEGVAKWVESGLTPFWFSS